MGAMVSQITSLTIVHSTVYSGAHQRKHQSSASLAFVWGIHRWPVNSPHQWPVTRKMFPFDEVIIMLYCYKVSLQAFLQIGTANPQGNEWDPSFHRSWSLMELIRFSQMFVNYHFKDLHLKNDIMTTRSEFSRWRHHVETVSALLALCAGNSPVTGEFPP